MIDYTRWPDVLTIPDKMREFKKDMLAVLRDDEEVQDDKERDLNYIVAVSSGKAVTEEIPKQIGRRAGWASNQGTNFVEIIIENPAQLIMDQDMLVNLADRLGLHYNIHSSTNLAYGMSYRQMQGAGFDPAQEYTVKLLKETKRFREALEEAEEHRGLRNEYDDPLPILYSINPHMAVGQMPAEEDRMARDVSVDPFGEEIRYSRLFDNKEFRLGLWKYYFWHYQDFKDDPQQFGQILNLIEDVDDLQDFTRDHIIDIMKERNYLSQDLIDFVRQLIRYAPRASQSVFNLSSQRLADMPEELEEFKNHSQGTSYAQQLARFDPEYWWTQTPDDQIIRFLGQPQRTQEGGMQFDPGPLVDADIVSEEYAREVVMGDRELTVPDSFPNTERLSLEENEMQDIQQNAQRRVLDPKGAAFAEVTEFFKSDDEEYEVRQKKPSEVMKRLAGSRRLFQGEFNKESTIFRRLMPLWMPFAENEGHDTVTQMWEGITGKSFDDHESLIDWLYDPTGPEDSGAMNNPRDEENVIAASTGAYVWGHFTQIPPGYDKTLVQYLDEAEVFWTFESHFVGGAENTRIWKPKDMIEVVKAINDTPVEWKNEQGETVDRRTTDWTRITIDMEHIATQQVNPLWVINGKEEEGYKGLEDGDGEYILMQHVTHPYLGEGGPGHFHGPIQRGDTLVYEYMYSLIDKGMAQTDDYATFMYELGSEKTETLFIMRLILRMIEHGIKPIDLKNEGGVTEILNKDEPENMKEYLIHKFFGITDTEVQHEWQEIFEHALDPLEDLLQAESGGHTWMGRAALQNDARPEEWQKEEWR